MYKQIVKLKPIPALAAILLLLFSNLATQASNPETKQTFVLKDINLIGNQTYSTAELSTFYTKYLNHEITTDTLQSIANNIQQKYHQAGYIFANAVLPEQNLTQNDAKANIQIIEGYLDKAVDEGKENKLTTHYKKKLINNKAANYKYLERYLLLMNKVPGLQVKSILSPSKENFGAATITLNNEFKKYAGSISYDNYGNPNIDLHQITTNLKIFNLLGLDEVSASLANSLKTPKDMRNFQLGYKIILPRLEGLEISLAYLNSNSSPKGSIEFLQMLGKNQKLSVNFAFPYMLSRAKTIYLIADTAINNNQKQDVLGSEYNQYLKFSLASILNYQYHNSSLDASCRLSQGAFIAEEISSILPGQPSDKERQELYNFTKAEVQLNYEKVLPHKFSAFISSKAQLSFKSSIVQEQLFYGGMEYGSAFANGNISCANGIILKTEARYNHMFENKLIHFMQLYANIDAIFTNKIHTPWFASFSLGQRSMLAHNLNLTLNFNYPIHTYPGYDLGYNLGIRLEKLF